MHLLKGNVRASLADARAALEKAERADDPVLLAAVIARVAQAEVWAADVTPGLLERGVEIEERLGLDLDYSVSPRVYMPRLIMRRGEIDRARALLEEVDARAVARGNGYTHMNALWYLSHGGVAGGPLAASARACDRRARGDRADPGADRLWRDASRRSSRQTSVSSSRRGPRSTKGWRTHETFSNEPFVIAALGVLGRLEFLLGNLPAAGDHLRELSGATAGGRVERPQPACLGGRDRDAGRPR